MKATAMNPRTELPHPRPKVLYMEGPAKGNNAPTRQRKIVLAVVTDAA
jgi:hypothetical protein